jgi:hypothetical protein
MHTGYILLLLGLGLFCIAKIIPWDFVALTSQRAKQQQQLE